MVQNIVNLLAHPEIDNALPGLILRPIRASIVMQRLQAIAHIDAGI